MGSGHPFFAHGGLDWAREQLREAGYEETNVAHLVRKVHETLAPYAHQDTERTMDAMPVIARLLQGQPLTEEYWTADRLAQRTHRWIRALPNSLTPGDVVRVRPDAYEIDGNLAGHNGRVGRVAGIRGGVLVTYDGTQGARMGYRHSADKLERQVPIPRGVTK
jgi:hypothetical protein